MTLPDRYPDSEVCDECGKPAGEDGCYMMECRLSEIEPYVFASNMARPYNF